VLTEPSESSGWEDARVRVTAKADYAVRAMVHIAGQGGSVKGEDVAEAQQIPTKYLEAILGDLRAAGLLRSQRGSRGGYRLALPADQIAVADVIRAVEGPLASVRGEPAEELGYPASTQRLQDLWIAVRAVLRDVLEGTSVADLAAGHLPPSVEQIAASQAAWESTAQRRVRGQQAPSADH
jgi:Rrf2 family protein